MLLIRLLYLYLLFESSNSQHDHYHDHDHDHDHNHNHVHHRGTSDGDEVDQQRSLDSYGFKILGKNFKSKEEFVQSGNVCRFVSPDSKRKEKSKKKLWKHETRKKKLKFWKAKIGKGRQMQSTLSEVSVQVHFHIIQKQDESGNIVSSNISDNQVDEQINILNDAYGGKASIDCANIQTTYGTATPFKFELATLERKSNSGWYDKPNSNNYEMFKELRRGNCSDLNIYSTGGDSYLGWATFPDECADNLLVDGVVIYEETLPGGSAAPYNLGDTLVHEVGHWLGLLHTFEGGCGNGDFVEDTPPENTSAAGCPISRDTCSGDNGLDPIHNFMDYSDDCCMYEFTGGQAERMTAVADVYRDLRSPDSSEEYANFLNPETSSQVQCENSESKLTVIIKTDEFGSETSWSVSHSGSTDTMFDEPPLGQVFSDLGTYEVSKCLSPGAYKFTINDAFGDGLCCENGNGSYSVFLDGELIASGGESFASQDHDFEVGTKCKDMSLKLKTDQFGEETSWTIKNSDGSTILDGSEFEDNSNFLVKSCLPLSDHYTFQIKDSEKDGICCNYGDGYYELSYDNAVIGVGGSFDRQTQHILGECPSGHSKFSLHIRMDRYATETRWKLLLSDWTLLDSGGYYYTESFSDFHYDTCLLTSKCYRFRIFDRAGDGICCSQGNGFYEINFNGFQRRGDVFANRQTTLFGGSCRVSEYNELLSENENEDITVRNKKIRRKRKNLQKKIEMNSKKKQTKDVQ